jgi:hypothetical protein
MAKLTEVPAYVVTLEHFTGTLRDVVAVFTDLEAAKALQRSYDDMTRITVTIHRTVLYNSSVKRSRPKKAAE